MRTQRRHEPRQRTVRSHSKSHMTRASAVESLHRRMHVLTAILYAVAWALAGVAALSAYNVLVWNFTKAIVWARVSRPECDEHTGVPHDIRRLCIKLCLSYTIGFVVCTVGLLLFYQIPHESIVESGSSGCRVHVDRAWNVAFGVICITNTLGIVLSTLAAILCAVEQSLFVEVQRRIINSEQSLQTLSRACARSTPVAGRTLPTVHGIPVPTEATVMPRPLDAFATTLRPAVYDDHAHAASVESTLPPAQRRDLYLNANTLTVTANQVHESSRLDRRLAIPLAVHTARTEPHELSTPRQAIRASINALESLSRAIAFERMLRYTADVHPLPPPARPVVQEITPSSAMATSWRTYV